MASLRPVWLKAVVSADSNPLLDTCRLSMLIMCVVKAKKMVNNIAGWLFPPHMTYIYLQVADTCIAVCIIGFLECPDPLPDLLPALSCSFC